MIQMIAYAISENNTEWQSQWKRLLLCLIIFSNFTLFPMIFPMPKYDSDEIVCGMPGLAITLGFWILGNIFTVLTHIFYNSISGAAKKSTTENGHQRTPPEGTQD
jgi:hypothetical protein